MHFDAEDYELPPEYRAADIKRVKPWFADVVRQYTADLEARRREYAGMLLAGSNGCGKTWTLSAVANAYADHVGMMRSGVRLISSYELIEKLYPTFSDREYTLFTTGETFTEFVENASVLILDDLGLEPPALHHARDSKLTRLLRARQKHRRGSITLVSTNLALDAKTEDIPTIDNELGHTLASALDRACPWRQVAVAPDLRREFIKRFPDQVVKRS